MRGSFIRIKNALKIAGPVGEMAIHQEMRVWVRILALCKKKKKKKDNMETPGIHDLGVARLP